jgi:hypothetical protein
MSVLRRILSAIRIRLGWGELSETRLSPDHGWLLRNPSPPADEPRPDPPK